MGIVLGMDEAGYGPNLGPLVVTATAWDVPGESTAFDFWTALGDVVSREPTVLATRFHVADSKQVYSPSRGLASLETSVLALLDSAGRSPGTFRELWDLLRPPADDCGLAEPWFDGADLPLPLAADPGRISALADRARDVFSERGVRMRGVRSDVVLTERFNRLTSDTDSKGVALSRISVALLRAVWDPDDATPTLVLADKHGGRNRYAAFLTDALDGRMVLHVDEGRASSRYRVGRSELRFEVRAERHFPVAVASMVAKYVREVSMELFNRFWQGHVPGLSPTRGYPEDAKRFRKDIAPAQRRLGIPDGVLWRVR